jgi:hypothetical protein
LAVVLAFGFGRLFAQWLGQIFAQLAHLSTDPHQCDDDGNSPHPRAS